MACAGAWTNQFDSRIYAMSENREHRFDECSTCGSRMCGHQSAKLDELLSSRDDSEKRLVHYRVPRRPDWKRHVICDNWSNGDHCGYCEPCYSGHLYHLKKYVETLRAECRRLAKCLT